MFIRFDTTHEHDTHTPHDGIGRTYASHRVAKIFNMYLVILKNTVNSTVASIKHYLEAGIS